MLSRYLLFLTLLVVAALITATAQQTTMAPEDAAVTYLERNWHRHDLISQADVEELVTTDVVTNRKYNRSSVHIRQGIDGIPIVDGHMVIAVDGNGRVFHAAGQLIPDLSSRRVHAGNGISPAAAANIIARETGFSAPEPFQVVSQQAGPTQKTELTDGGGHTFGAPTAELVYIVDNAGDLRLAWDATLTLHGDDGQWRGLIDAGSGTVLRLDDVLVRDHFGEHVEPPLVLKRERTIPGLLPRPTAQSAPSTGECYRVFAWPLMDPFHTDPAWPDDTRTWECDPFDPVASPDGWHDDDGDGTPDYTILRGNNVHAFPDHNNTDSPNPGDVDGGADLHFDFPIDFSLHPNDYLEASVTNLFYWNNLFHDIIAHYGFDEAHGNFQEHNYTLDGLGGDYVNANAQDGGGSNNANFSRTSDGQNPRMQMYLGVNHNPFMDGSLDNHVVLHEYGHGVSIRMTGGPSDETCLFNAEQGGEGWSDWYGLVLTMDETAADFGRNVSRGVGTFLMWDDAPNGIRLAPYNTDFSVNDHTYASTTLGIPVPHGIGFVWATILWEVTWDLIDTYGYNQNINAVDDLSGNIIMMNLVTEAFNIQPCSPGFVDSRDAILAAVDVVYSDQPVTWREDLKHLMWEGFARRGLGYFADQGSPGSNGDNIEDFTVPSVLPPDAVTDLATTPDGDFVTLTWSAPDDPDSEEFNYHARYASEPILTETDWVAATPVPAAEDMVPQAPGAAEELVVTGLDFETTYHFAIRSHDEANTSDLSNSEEVTTLAPPVANVPLDPIQVAVPPETEETVNYTISNDGPSTLSYSVDFNDTTEGLQRTPVPKPDPSDRQDAPSREDVEDVSPAGEPQRMGEGGPDAFGYRWIDSNELHGPTYDWVDITETGTEVELGTDDHVVVDLPFDFPYYQNTFNWVAIQSKGALTFADTTLDFVNKQIPAEDDWNGMIAGYWDDLNPDSTTGGGAVYYDTLDDGRFVVSWIDVPHYLETGSFTFQIILEPAGGIIYQYQAIDGGGTHDNSATVGIENRDGTDGLQIVYNAPYVEDGLAVRFIRWLGNNPFSGQIASGEALTFPLLFSSLGLDGGTYTADMIVTTNEVGDNLSQEYTVPITMTVEGIGTDDDDLAFEGTHRLSAVAPNPVNGLARTTLEVAEAQDVQVELFDVRGRKVVTAFEGVLAARTAQEVTLDAGAIAPGVYVLRVSGETFSETQRVTIIR